MKPVRMFVNARVKIASEQRRVWGKEIRKIYFTRDVNIFYRDERQDSLRWKSPSLFVVTVLCKYKYKRKSLLRSHSQQSIDRDLNCRWKSLCSDSIL